MFTSWCTHHPSNRKTFKHFGLRFHQRFHVDGGGTGECCEVVTAFQHGDETAFAAALGNFDELLGDPLEIGLDQF
jgi:hypothetical protein